MLATRLFKITRHFNVQLPPKTRILPSKSIIILNPAFLCTVKVQNVTDVKPDLHPRSYYRQYLLKNSAYKNYLFTEKNIVNPKIVALLNQLQEENENNLELKNELLEYLKKEAVKFSFDELCEVLFMMNRIISEKSSDPFWKEISTLLDDECYPRIPTWSLDKILIMTDAVVQSRKSIWSLGKLYLKLVTRTLNVHQTVLLYHFLWQKRYIIPTENQFNMQQKIIEFIPYLNSTELGIIAQGILKTFKTLRNADVIPAMLKKTLEDIDSIEKVPLNSICKVACSLSKKVHIDAINEFQKKAINTALKFGAENIVNLALTGEKLNFLDPNLKTTLMKTVKDEIKQISVHHIERVAYLTIRHNIQDDEFIKLAVDELESRELSLQHKLILIHFLNNLTHHKTYPEKLLGYIFEEGFVDKIPGLSLLHSWWETYCNLEIEKPECLNFQLTPRRRKKINGKHRAHIWEKNEKHFHILWRIREILKELFGDDTVNDFIPLPQYKKGLLLRFDKDLKPQKLPNDFQLIEKSFPVRPLQDGHVWMFLTIAYSWHLADYSQNLPNLILQTKLRQLSALGYTPVPVYRYGKEIPKEYFENLISAKLEEIRKDRKDAACN